MQIDLASMLPDPGLGVITYPCSLFKHSIDNTKVFFFFLIVLLLVLLTMSSIIAIVAICMHACISLFLITN